MHGRLKVKTTAEQQAEKKKEKDKKLAEYLLACEKFFHKKKENEYDEDSDSVSRQLLLSNADFYTVWNFRKELLLNYKILKSEGEFHEVCQLELGLTESCLKSNPKSYGAWHHRSWVLLNDPESDWEKELKLCKAYLQLDDRNFHCWDHRRFVVDHGKFPADGEIKFTIDLINNNFSNYSSWQYRSKLLTHHSSKEENTLLAELELVQNATFTDPSDQSGWLYYQWLLGGSKRGRDIMYVNYDKEQKVFLVCYTQALEQSEVSVDIITEGEGAIIWESPGMSRFSRLWSAKLQDTCKVVAVKLSENDKISINESSDLFQIKNFSTWFLHQISPTVLTYLQRELCNYEELLSLEPDSKWTLLTTAHIMKYLDSKKPFHEKIYCNKILESYDRLIELDPYRRNYYLDSKGKEVVEQKISGQVMGGDVGSIDLSCLELISLTHKELLAPFKEIRLSKNNLTKLDAKDFICCRRLYLDHNKLKNFNDPLPNCLEYLDISNNEIGKLEDVFMIFPSSKLSTLLIAGNPICNNADEISSLKRALPTAEIITQDGISR